MKFRLKLISVSLILFIFVMGCSTPEDKKLNHFKKGTEYFQAKEYKKAEIEFKNAIQIDKHYTDAFLKLGDTMMKLGQFREAFATYSQVEKISPDNIQALVNLAKLYFLNKQQDEAKIRIEKILDQDKDNIDALYLKAQVLTRQKKFETAGKIFQKIIEIQNNHIPSLQGLARIKSFQKKFDQAESLLLKAVDTAPNTTQPRFALFSFYISRKDLSKAEEQLKLTAKENPDNADHQIVLGNFYLKIRNQALAEAAYKKAVEITPDKVKPYLSLAGFYNAVGKDKKALEVFKRAVTIDLKDITARQALARFQYKTKNVDAAEKLVSEILEQRPKYYPAKMLQSEILISKKEFEKALHILTELAKEEPRAYRVRYFKGLSHIGLGDTNQATESVANAVELKPDYIRARLLLADIYFRQRTFDLAEKHASEVLALDDSIYQALIIRANSRLGMGKFKEAEKDYKNFMEKNPNNPSAYYRLAALYSSQKRYDEAEDLLVKALSINKELINVFSLRVKNSTLLKNFKKAHNLCEKQLYVTKNNKRNKAIVYNVQASVYMIEKDPDNAAKSYRKAIETDPDYLRSYSSLAQIFITQKDLKNAISQYDRILDKNSDIASPHMMLGTIYEMQKNFAKAEKHYRKALEINPDFAPAANNLAYLLADRTDKYDDALKYAKIAKEQLPDEPGVMDTIGWVYYKKGLYGNAVGEFIDSLKQIPYNPIVNYHLGLAYNKKGDIELSKKALARSLELNDNFPGAKKAEALLKELK